MSDISVIMCSWNRPWYIPKMIESVQKQTVKPKEFVIWNNNIALRDELEGYCRGTGIILYHSGVNVGGFGRFYAARDIAGAGFVVFIDDDWCLKPGQVEVLDRSKRPDSLVGLWCWKYNRRAERSRVVSGGCDYIGTCGQISTRGIYDDKGLYGCPKKYWFLEDIWLSFYAKYSLGRGLFACGRLEDYASNMNRDSRGNLIEKVPGLSHKMWGVKPEFVRFLINRYWGGGNV